MAGLVYIAAFGLDQGESLGGLLGGGPPTPALAHLIVDEQGFAWLPEEDFVGHFASDVETSRAKVMCAVQQGLLSLKCRLRGGNLVHPSSTSSPETEPSLAGRSDQLLAELIRD